MVRRERLPAVAALAVPVLAGLAWMGASGAPAHYLLVNAGALVLAAAWIVFGRGPHTAASRHILAAALIVIMLVPLRIGPEALSTTGDRVVRWFPLGGDLAVHTGMLVTPALVVLAARNRALAAPLLLAGVFAALLQPDAGTGFALTFAAVGLHHVTRDWKVGVTALVAFFAAILMALAGQLPPAPFVENVLQDAAQASWIAVALLAGSLIACFALLLTRIPFDTAKRFSLAGLFFGFVVMALMQPYPTPLVGYSAAPILGFGLALGLHRIPKR